MKAQEAYRLRCILSHDLSCHWRGGGTTVSARGYPSLSWYPSPNQGRVPQSCLGVPWSWLGVAPKRTLDQGLGTYPPRKDLRPEAVIRNLGLEAGLPPGKGLEPDTGVPYRTERQISVKTLPPPILRMWSVIKLIVWVVVWACWRKYRNLFHY